MGVDGLDQVLHGGGPALENFRQFVAAVGRVYLGALHHGRTKEEVEAVAAHGHHGGPLAFTHVDYPAILGAEGRFGGYQPVPVHIAGIATGHRSPQHVGPHGGMDAIGPNHQISSGAVAVFKNGGGGLVILLHRHAGHPQMDILGAKFL